MEIPSANDDAWITAEGNEKGKPSLLRFRPNLERCLADPGYPRRLTITWIFDSGNSSGLPSSEQIDDMRAFEDAIIDALDPDRCGVLAFVFTGDGVRQWHFYIRNTQEVGKRINAALSGFPRLPIELSAEDDDDWSELQKVLRMCK